MRFYNLREVIQKAAGVGGVPFTMRKPPHKYLEWVTAAYIIWRNMAQM